MSAQAPTTDGLGTADGFLAAATAYLAQGWAVMPLHVPDEDMPGGCSCGKKCASPAKHPTCPHGIYDASKKPKWIASWAEARPYANIGIRTGAVSNLVALDLDAKHGGMDTIADLEATHGVLPATLTALTPSGGQHRLFLHPGGVVGNNAGVLGLGVDVRGDNGYIAAAPSLGMNGKQYRWVDAALPVAVLPDAWIALLPRPRERTLGVVRPAGGLRDEDVVYWVNKYAAQAKVGNRNAKAFELACQLRDAGCSQTDAELAMSDYVSAVPGGDYTLDEALKSTASAYSQAPRAEAKSQSMVGMPPLRLIQGQARGSAVALRETAPDEEHMHDPWAVAPTTPPLSTSTGVPVIGLDELRYALNREEYGDAQIMHRLFHRQVVYDHGRKQWFFWAGHAWEEDRRSQVVHLVGATLTAAYLHGAATGEKALGVLQTADPKDDDKIAEHKKLIKRLLERAHDLHMRKRMVNVLTNAQSFLGITGDEWDRRPDLLAVENGVVHLETGELRAGMPGDYLRTVAPTTWQGLDCPAPRWELFLEEMFAGRMEMPSFMQRLCGHSARGEVVEHQLPILYGPGGRNGKDKFMEAINGTLGPVLASTVEHGVLLGGPTRAGAASPHLMKLQGKRFAWVVEPNEHAQLNVGQVKLLTGGTEISARQLHGKSINFVPSHMLWLITNYLPHGSANDHALWSRVLCIECKERFVAEPDANNPHEHLQDVALPEKLRAEYSGILAWIVRGHIAWRLHGLSAPDEVRQATTDYQESQDSISTFLEDVCIEDSTKTVRAVALYDAYRAWAGKQAMSQQHFGTIVRAKYEHKRQNTGFVYIGISLPVVNALLRRVDKDEDDDTNALF